MQILVVHGEVDMRFLRRAALRLLGLSVMVLEAPILRDIAPLCAFIADLPRPSHSLPLGPVIGKKGTAGIAFHYRRMAWPPEIHIR